MSNAARPSRNSDQIRTLGQMQGGTPAQIEGLVAAWTSVFNAARDPKTPDTEPLGVPHMGTQLPALYWRDWLHRNPVQTLSMLQVPALVLRGDNDRNVTHEDFDLMRKAATASGSAAREFPGLNHEYMAASGDGRSAYVAGEIAPEVFNTIAQWVKTGQISQ